jgi:hypothetical protein
MEVPITVFEKVPCADSSRSRAFFDSRPPQNKPGTRGENIGEHTRMRVTQISQIYK